MIRGIKGIKDITPDRIPGWTVVEQNAHTLAQVFGFREIRIPVFEKTELYVRGLGDATDLVEKEMYTFSDKDGTSLTLRPEGTAGVVRAFIEQGLKADPSSRKLYYIGPMFRHERPQAGRFRQFHQFGVESIGNAHPDADVEVITLLWRYFSTLCLPGLALEINSLGDPPDRREYAKAFASSLKGQAPKLCGNCRRRLDTNPLRILDCKVPQCRETAKGAPSIVEFLSQSSRQHFDHVLRGLRTLNVPYTVNPCLVRGLDYYALTTFEVSCSALGAQNAIGAGGRYNGLFQTLGGPDTPAVGFAIGLERVILALPDSMLPSPDPWVFIASFGERGKTAGLSLLDSLRAKHVKADTDSHATTLRSLLRSADRLGAPYVAILGDDEVAADRVVLRDMTTKEQEIHSLGTASSAITRRIQHSRTRRNVY